MKIKVPALLLASYFLLFAQSAFSGERNEFVTTLKVALYPYVPDRQTLFYVIEEMFEAENPGVNLELVDDENLLWDYYSGGLQKTEADVYEVDTILLADLIRAGKISPTDIPIDGNLPEAVTAVTRGDKIYGVPHWVCGNFLFYRKGDSEIESAKTWAELAETLSKRKESLFIDFKGKSTLGEWYLTALSEIHGFKKAQEMALNSEELDKSVLDKLKEVLQSCPAGYCRSDDLHDIAGYYARSFIAGHASAYVGYSESIHYGIQYALDNCTETSSCIPIGNIAVRSLPKMVESSATAGVGWVDALTIDANIDPQKKELAKQFIEFLVSERAYKAILEPEWGKSPMYLLPAKDNVVIKDAPLYKAFYAAHIGRETGTKEGLNDRLRGFGKKLDCALPINRTDVDTLEKCKN